MWHGYISFWLNQFFEDQHLWIYNAQVYICATVLNSLCICGILIKITVFDIVKVRYYFWRTPMTLPLSKFSWHGYKISKLTQAYISVTQLNGLQLPYAIANGVRSIHHCLIAFSLKPIMHSLITSSLKSYLRIKSAYNSTQAHVPIIVGLLISAL